MMVIAFVCAIIAIVLCMVGQGVCQRPYPRERDHMVTIMAWILLVLIGTIMGICVVTI